MPNLRIDIDDLVSRFSTQPEGLIPFLDRYIKEFSKEQSIQFFYDLGQIFRERDLFRLAYPLYAQTLLIGEELKLAEVIAECHNTLGIVARSLGETELAETHYRLALQRLEALNDREGIAMCHNNLGVLYYNRGEFQTALKCYQEALRIDKKLGKEVEVAVDWMNLAICYEELGKNEQAFSLYQKALERFAANDRLKSQARCLLSMGGIYYQNGQYELSVQHQQYALDIATKINSPLLVAKCHNNIGLNYCEIGRYREAVEHLEFAEKLSEASGEWATRARNTSLLGSLYYELEHPDKALHFFRQSLDMAVQEGNRLAAAFAYGNLGRTYAAKKTYAQAIEHFRHSKLMLEQLQHPSGVIKALLNLARIYYLNDDIQNSEASLSEAQALNEQYFQSPSVQAGIHLHLSNIYMDTGREEEGRVLQHKILSYALANDHIGLQQMVRLNSMLDLVRSGDLQQALAEGKKAIDLTEAIFADLMEEEHLLGSAKTLSQHYHHLILISIELRQNRIAFDYIEKSKSRAFLSLMRGISLLPVVNVDHRVQQLIHQEQQLLQAVKRIQLRGFQPGVIKLEPGQTGKINQQLKTIYQELEKMAPTYVNLRRGQSLGFNALQYLLR